MGKRRGGMTRERTSRLRFAAGTGVRVQGKGGAGGVVRLPVGEGGKEINDPEPVRSVSRDGFEG